MSLYSPVPDSQIKIKPLHALRLVQGTWLAHVMLAYWNRLGFVPGSDQSRSVPVPTVVSSPPALPAAALPHLPWSAATRRGCVWGEGEGGGNIYVTVLEFHRY